MVFVSYIYSNEDGSYGFGNVCIDTKGDLKCWSDVEWAKDEIKSENPKMKSCTILFWRELQ